MIRQVLRSSLVACSLALLVAACGDSVTGPSSTSTGTTNTPTAPATVSATETFEGSLASGGSNFHIFHTMPGVFNVVLTSVEPSASLPAVGLSFGMWDGISCNGVLGTEAAVTSTTMVGTASIETDVCVRIWDPATWDPALVLTYTISATHFKKAS